jgi:hypothetical protein
VIVGVTDADGVGLTVEVTDGVLVGVGLGDANGVALGVGRIGKKRAIISNSALCSPK